MRNRQRSLFLAVSDSYVAEWTTVERFADVLGRLEAEVFGRAAGRQVLDTGFPWHNSGTP